MKFGIGVKLYLSVLSPINGAMELGLLGDEAIVSLDLADLNHGASLDFVFIFSFSLGFLLIFGTTPE